MKFSLAFRLTALLLIPAVLSSNLAIAEKTPPDPTAIKATLTAHGVGAGIRVTMTDHTQARGILISIGDQSFSVKSKSIDQPREIQYVQVTGVHGTGLSTGAKIGIGVAIGAVAVVVGLVLVLKKSQD